MKSALWLLILPKYPKVVTVHRKFQFAQSLGTIGQSAAITCVRLLDFIGTCNKSSHHSLSDEAEPENASVFEQRHSESDVYFDFCHMFSDPN